MNTPEVHPAPPTEKNPLVRSGEDTAITEGAGLFHDATEAITGFADGNWAEGLLNVTSAVGGVGSFLADPLAGLFSAGFGWLMEHVDFLREPLDWLTGDQQTLDGMAQTWSSVSSYLSETSDLLKETITTGTAAWQGDDSARYRSFGNDRADTYGAVALAARGMSLLITACRTILKVVRDIVRDLVSEAVGKLISICLRWAPAFAAFGAGVAGAVAECVPTAVMYANKALGWCRKLTKAFSRASALFSKLDSLLGNAQTTLAKRGDDFVTALKQGANADITRHMADFSWRAMAKDAWSGTRAAVIDGVTGLPKDIGPKMLGEFRREGAKILDNHGWQTWQELEEEEKAQGG